MINRRYVINIRNVRIITIVILGMSYFLYYILSYLLCYYLVSHPRMM